jgi:uncharacterized membrane protein
VALGPLELMVLAFPEPRLVDGARAAFELVERAGDMRIADALVVSKDKAGTVTSAELADVVALREVSAAYRLAERSAAGLIDIEDVNEVGGQLDPDTTALTLLVEHVWVRDLAEAAVAAGGVLVASVPVPATYAAEAERALTDGSDPS